MNPEDYADFFTLFLQILQIQDILPAKISRDYRRQPDMKTDYLPEFCKEITNEHLSRDPPQSKKKTARKIIDHQWLPVHASLATAECEATGTKDRQFRDTRKPAASPKNL